MANDTTKVVDVMTSQKCGKGGELAALEESGGR